MSLDSPVVFPLFPIITTPEGPICACGQAKCGRIGKHPRVAWGDLKLGDEVARPEPGAGFGIKTGARPHGSDIFVVDIDGYDANAALEALAEASGGDIPDTYTVETGRLGGAWQLYFKHPGFNVRNSVGELAPGVDIRGDGGFVVGPGSPHKSGKRYIVDSDIPVAEAPPWLLAWLRARPAAGPTQAYPGDLTEGAEYDHRLRLFEKYLKTTSPCISGQGGDKRLFEVVQYGAYDLQLPTDDVLSLIGEHFDPRCVPPWHDELEAKVLHKAHCAKTASTRPRAEPVPHDLAALVGVAPSFVEALTGTPAPKKKQKVDGIVWGGWEEPVPPPEYVVHGLIPVSTVGCFVAMGSSLKTWTAVDLARAVAKGEAWLGRYPVKQGKALIIDFESGLYELRRRVRLLEGGGEAVDPRITELGVWSYPDGMRIDAEDLWRCIAGIDGVRLVIIDSLAAGASNVDENERGVALPLELASRVANMNDETGPSVIFIHHSKKDDGDDRKMMRGSTAIYAACDWAYKFEQIEETRTRRRMEMHCIKPCMGPKPAPVNLELSDDGLKWFDSRPEVSRGDVTSAAAEDTPEAIQAAILLALDRAGAAGLANKDEIARKIGRRAEKVRPEIAILTERKQITKLEGTGYVLDSDEARLRRIVRAVRDNPAVRTEGEIAAFAGATVLDVKKAQNLGSVHRSADGRWLALDVVRAGDLTG